MQLLYGRLCVLFFAIFAFAFCLAMTAFAADAAPEPARPIALIMPYVIELAGAVLAALGGWLMSRLVKLIGVTDAAKRLEVEAHLRQALHFAAENGLRFALTRAGVAGAEPAAEQLADAMFYVQSKNPDTLDKLGVSDDALRDIVLSKWPLVTPSFRFAAQS